MGEINHRNNISLLFSKHSQHLITTVQFDQVSIKYILKREAKDILIYQRDIQTHKIRKKTGNAVAEK